MLDRLDGGEQHAQLVGAQDPDMVGRAELVVEQHACGVEITGAVQSDGDDGQGEVELRGTSVLGVQENLPLRQLGLYPGDQRRNDRRFGGG